ncbi:hypothetical protein, partial [Streptomyces sp. NPDC020362]|uniref:hypothetical protein n=1 Tax=Streptomyces sp. NPDC020362 TaxID=3154486 RepID=UPI0033FF964D
MVHDVEGAKVAEDAYEQARELVRRILRRAPTQPDASNSATLLVADDPDARITLCLWSNITDEALRALSSLDLNELTAQRPDARAEGSADRGGCRLRPQRLFPARAR